VQAGWGEVCQARDTRLGRTVALRFISGAEAGQPARLARFRREAEAIARVNHPKWSAPRPGPAHPRRFHSLPAQMDRVDLRTGRRTAGRALAPADAVGVEAVSTVLVTAYGRSYCYGYLVALNDLFVLTGLK
jgi:serine/threonine protein kinase